MPLVEAAGGRYRVVRVSDEDSALLGWLNEKGVKIGEEYDVSDSDRAAGLLELSRRGGKRFQLGLQVAGQVFVEALP
jgi:hypothetical protein